MLLLWCSWFLGLAYAACPYMNHANSQNPSSNRLKAREANPDLLDQYKVDDSNSYLTTDAGGPIQDDASLKAGERGPTLLEDFILRQKIQHFDHERVSLGNLY